MSEVSIGDPLVMQGTKRTINAIRLLDSTYRSYSAKSDVYLKYAESDLYDMYGAVGGSNKNGDTIKKKKAGGELCPFQITGGGYTAGFNCFKDVSHEEIKDYVVRNLNGFQQSLIYNGKIGSKINIGYRESSDDSVRPAFNNNVEYDMSESLTIAYKGAVLEVVDYTNTGIKYKLIRNFNTN